MPVCISKESQLLSVISYDGTRYTTDNTMELWHIGRCIRVGTFRFGSQAPLRFEDRERFGFYGHICYSTDDCVLICGSDDGTLRFLDARLFVTPEDRPHIQMNEYHPSDTSEMTEDRNTWPEWWQEVKIEVLKGFYLILILVS